MQAVAFDLDGTMYQGNTMIDGAQDVIRMLNSNAIPTFYFSNNSSRTRKDLYNKLINFGLNLSPQSIYNSAYATAFYLSRNEFYNVYCIGSKGLVEELNSRHIAVSSSLDKNINAIVVGLDINFSYEKISCALKLLKQGVQFIACNKDKNYPVESGNILPGCGALVAAIEYASGKVVDFNVGKPNTFMLELLSNDHHIPMNEILIIGDTYESDISMAHNSGSPAVFLNWDSKFFKKEDDIMSVRDLFELKKILQRYFSLV